MVTYVCLIQFQDQGIRNIKDTVKRGDAAIAEAEKMGVKIVQEYWTMGAYDAVVVLEAPDDETMSAFILKVGSLGNVKGQTLRALAVDYGLLPVSEPSWNRRLNEGETVTAVAMLTDLERLFRRQPAAVLIRPRRLLDPHL